MDRQSLLLGCIDASKKDANRRNKTFSFRNNNWTIYPNNIQGRITWILHRSNLGLCGKEMCNKQGGNAKKFLADFSRPEIKEGCAKTC